MRSNAVYLFALVLGPIVVSTNPLPGSYGYGSGGAAPGGPAPGGPAPGGPAPGNQGVNCNYPSNANLAICSSKGNTGGSSTSSNPCASIGTGPGGSGMGGPNGMCVNKLSIIASNKAQKACMSGNKGWQPNCSWSQNAALAACGGATASQSSPTGSSSSGTCGNVNPCSGIGSGPGIGGPGMTGPNGICINCDYPSNNGQWSCQNGFKSWQPNCKLDQHKNLAACGGSCPPTPVAAKTTSPSPVATAPPNCLLPMNFGNPLCSCQIPMNSNLPQCKPVPTSPKPVDTPTPAKTSVYGQKATSTPVKLPTPVPTSKPATSTPTSVDCSNVANYGKPACACTNAQYSTLPRCQPSTITTTTTPAPTATPESTQQTAAIETTPATYDATSTPESALESTTQEAAATEYESTPTPASSASPEATPSQDNSYGYEQHHNYKNWY